MFLVQIFVATVFLLTCTRNIDAFTNLSFRLQSSNNKNKNKNHHPIKVYLWEQGGKGNDNEQLQNQQQQQQQQQQQHQSLKTVSRRLFFSAAAATVVVSTIQSNNIASALETLTNEVPVIPVLQSSSVHVAETIRTLDMSLPTSYDELKSSKASVANVKSLSIDAKVPSGSSTSVQKSKSSSSSTTATASSSSSTSSSSVPKKEKEKPVKVGEYIF